MHPPKPPQFTQDDWDTACIRNPNPQKFVPDALVGAGRLQTRTMEHQKLVGELDTQITALRTSARTLAERQQAQHQHLVYTQQRAHTLRLQLIRTLKLVEYLRCFHQPLQEDELIAYDRLRQLLGKLQSFALPPSESALGRDAIRLQLPEENGSQLFSVVQESRKSLTESTLALQQEQRDVKLIRDRVLVRSQGAPHGRP